MLPILTSPVLATLGGGRARRLQCLGLRSSRHPVRVLHPPFLQGQTEPLESCVAKLQRTKRPGRDELASLLPELEALPVQPEEGELLGRVVRKFDRWRVSTKPPSLRLYSL